MSSSHDTAVAASPVNPPGLVAAGLVYLAIPNILFLMGWATPWAALAGSALILLFVVRAIVFQIREARGMQCSSGCGRWLLLSVLGCTMAVTLVFLSGGIVGLVPTAWDYSVFRQALFCNLRDAPWPVVLPNGKEMTYYIANMLPPALMARVLPSCLSQWCIVVWTCIPVVLSLLMITNAVQSRFRSRAVALWAVFLVVLLIRDPFWMVMSDIWYPIQRKVLYAFSFLPYDLSFLCRPPQITVLPNPLHECLGAYNSTPCVMLAAALMVTCRPAAKYMIPLVMVLMVALSPLGSVGLFPLAVCLYIQAWRKNGGKLSSYLPDCILPAFLLVVMAVYFCRADSLVTIAFGVSDRGLLADFIFFVRILVVWLVVVYPLWKAVGKDPLFRVVALMLLFGQMVFVGTMRGMNDSWLKFSPAYVLLLGMYYIWYWRRVNKIKFAVFAVCGLNVLLVSVVLMSQLGCMPYGEVKDDWNGHLNHDAPHLLQSVPPCKAPMIPGLLLRESGESETCFPGCLLPKAPGCDYSRPPAK